jgi:uncharacterized membrane protein
MTTPIIILSMLVGPLVILHVASRITGRNLLDASWRGCIGIALVFCFTGVGHFIKMEPMAEMLPPWVPGRIPLVYFTGVIELSAAAVVLIPRVRRLIGWGLIVMLVPFLPVNIYAAVNQIGMGGHQWGPVYLLIRIPLQAILIGWTWWFAVRTCREQ